MSSPDTCPHSRRLVPSKTQDGWDRCPDCGEHFERQDGIPAYMQAARAALKEARAKKGHDK